MVKIINEKLKHFERGRTPKDTLELGRKHFTKTSKGFKQAFNDDLSNQGFLCTSVYTWSGKIDSIEFRITEKKFKEDFALTSKELVKFLAKWLNENTIFYLDDLSILAYGDIRETDPIIRWNLDLKRWGEE